jgi:hypothetical protein
MNAHYSFSDLGYNARLVIGWTLVVAGVLIIGFHLPTASILMTIGICVVVPAYYARTRNEQSSTRTTVRQRPARQKPKERSKKEQALEYRDLFLEGIISFEEYHDAVAQLYPELNRCRLMNTNEAQQDEDADAE